MKTYFSLIYIKPNRYSEEQIAVGMLGAIDGVPFFYTNDKKLSFSLKMIDKTLHSLIRKGFKLLSFDINKYREGRESLPLFEDVISLKYLKEIHKNKRGKISYSNPMEFDKTLPLALLVKKYLGVDPKEATKEKVINPLTALSETNKFSKFQYRKTLKVEDFPQLLSNARIDLLRSGSYFTSFHFIDLSKSLNSLRNEINRYHATIQALVDYANTNSLGKGRHYLVYDKALMKERSDLLKKVELRSRGFYELIPIKEIKDKV